MTRTVPWYRNATAQPDQDQAVASRPPAGRLTILATALAAGIALAWQLETPFVWPWLCGAVVAAIGAAAMYRRPRVALAALILATFAIGAAWLNIHHFHIAANDLASFATTHPKLVRITGIATRDPQLRQQSGGSLSSFDYRRPATYFPMTVDSVLDSDGNTIAATGAVYVRLDETVAPFRAGDRVTVFGKLRAPATPRNPGEFNYARYARSLGQAGMLTVPRRELVEIEPADRSSPGSTFLAWRETVRQRATGWLLSDLPAASPQQDALLVALLLGRREPQLDEISDSFKRIGLAYLLAISGMHLAVVAAGVVFGARLVGVSERGCGVLLVLVAIAYLFLVEVRLPVLRAGVMLITVGAALALARQVRLSGAISLAAIALLIWRPDQLITPGFQLSFGVVLGLMIFAPRLRSRWFGLRNNNPVSVGQMLVEWLKTTSAAAVVAWLIATPIVAWHFGMLCPLAAPLSIVAIPLVGVLLLVGYTKMLLAAILPSAALLVAIPLTIAAQFLLAVVAVIDEAPGSTLQVPPPSAVWAAGALLWSVAWINRGLWDRSRGRLRWPLVVAAMLLIVWLYWPQLPIHNRPALRVDVLAVGDGSCAVLRSGGKTVVVDAGGQNLDLGERIIVPALRRMNVFHVDTVVITHANLDHFAAVIEVVDAFKCREVLISPQFERAAQMDFEGTAASLLQLLAVRNVAVRIVSAGFQRQLGDASMTVLHPPAEAIYERVNDTSMVLNINAADRTVLLAGDIQQQAIEQVLAEYPRLQVDVAEIPHHGSHNESAIAFIEYLNPSVVFQSCGWSRYSRDRWAKHLAGIDRLITARDGMCTITIEDTGNITVDRFVEAAPPN